MRSLRPGSLLQIQVGLGSEAVVYGPCLSNGPKRTAESEPLEEGPDPTVTLVANLEVGNRCGFQGLLRRYSGSRNGIRSVVLNAGWVGQGIRHQCQQFCHEPPIREQIVVAGCDVPIPARLLTDSLFCQK